jgi:hypothetical protein
MFKASDEFIRAIVASLVNDPSIDHNDECNPLFSWGRFFYRDYLECEESARDGFGISHAPSDGRPL